MNSQSNLEPSLFQARNSGSSARCVSKLEVSALKIMAAKALLALFDGREMLFSRRITLRERGFRREPGSPRHTVIALLGLQCLAGSGERQPFDLPSIEKAVFQDKNWI